MYKQVHIFAYLNLAIHTKIIYIEFIYLVFVLHWIKYAQHKQN